MRTIFVQIKCELGRAYDVATNIADELSEGHVYSTSGPYDLLVMFNLDEDTDPGIFVSKRLHALPGIRETNTILAFNAFTPSTSLRTVPPS